MSVRSCRLVLTSEARADLRDILAYSEQECGKHQRREYERQISESLNRLTTYPHLGRSRPDYGPNVLSFPVRQHVIIYEATDKRISVVRVLHGRRDAQSQFETREEE